MFLSIPRSAFLWAIAGVVIEALAYPRWSLFPLAYPVLAFYLSAIYQIKNIKQALQIGIVVTMIAGFAAFHWITFVLTEMGGFPWIVGALLHTLFNFVVLPNFNCFFLLGFLLKDKIELLPLPLRPVFWAALWTALEFVFRPFKIFPEMAGNTQWSWLEVSQIASFGGVGAISFLVMLCGACLFYVIREPRRKLPYALLGAWAIALGIAHFWGANRIREIEALPREEITVAMIQANIGNADKAIAISGSLAGLTKVLTQYRELTSTAISRNPDLVIWPETAFPLSYPTGPEYFSHSLAIYHGQKIQEEARAGGYAHLVGGYENKGREEFNAAVLVGSDGVVQTSYKKVHLLIFGEYMPFATIWPSLKQLNPVLGDFGTGKGPFPLEWKRPEKDSIQLGVNICYEALIMDFMRDLALNGSHVFVNLTNDSWFGPGNEPYQHLELAAHRTIENGIGMIRATNTGISIVLDATGKTLFRGPLYESQVVAGKVPIYRVPIDTFYRRHGELVSYLIILLCLGLAIFAWTRAGRKGA